MSKAPEQLPDQLPTDPLLLVEQWLAQAEQTQQLANPNAMVIATADAHGVPSARVVLCKEVRAQPGYLTFFTHYRSRKGSDLAANPRAAAVMSWDALRRQVRIEGPVTRTTVAESDAYFASRAWRSRIGAWASEQSAPIASRAELAHNVERAAKRFGTPSPLDSDAASPDPGVAIPRPSDWGGYHLWAEAVELWVEGVARLHDRARWTRTLAPSEGGFRGGPWSATRLHP